MEQTALPCQISFRGLDSPFYLEVNPINLLGVLPLSHFPQELRDFLSKNPKRLASLTRSCQPFEPLLRRSTGSSQITIPIQTVFKAPEKVSKDTLLTSLKFIQFFIDSYRQHPISWDLETLEAPFRRNEIHMKVIRKEWASQRSEVRKLLLRGLKISEDSLFHQMIASAEATEVINLYSSDDYLQYLKEMQD